MRSEARDLAAYYPLSLQMSSEAVARLADTDGADPRTVLEVTRYCAARWAPDARIIGNVRAGDILRALSVAIPLMPKPKPVRCTRTIDMFEGEAVVQRT